MQGLNHVKNRVSVQHQSVFGNSGGQGLYNILASASIHCLSGVTNGGAIQHGPWPVAKPKVSKAFSLSLHSPK
jgi:hypothetical protein